MKKFFLLPLAMLSLVTFNSCKKDDPEEENKKPTVNLTYPTEDIYTANSSYPVTMTAEARDSDGSIEKVEFYVNGAKVFTDTNSPFMSGEMNINVNNNIVFNAIAYDNDGATTEKSVTIDIIQAP
jgi:chitinase